MEARSLRGRTLEPLVPSGEFIGWDIYIPWVLVKVAGIRQALDLKNIKERHDKKYQHKIIPGISLVPLECEGVEVIWLPAHPNESPQTT